MKKALMVLGVLMLAQLVFVGLVHVLIRVQGKDSPETMESLHGMPLIGGFFIPPKVVEEELDPEQVRDAETVHRLRESLELYELPEGFSREELEGLAHDLASARTESQQQRLDMNQERVALDAEKREATAERQRLEQLAVELTSQAESLQAALDEVTQRENRLEDAQRKNLGIVRATYEKMEPIKAAEILAAMDEDLVARILSGMSERNSARILQEFDVGDGGSSKAVGITKRMMLITSGTADKSTGG